MGGILVPAAQCHIMLIWSNFMTIFKTKYTPDQIAEHLYFLCIMDKEANSSIQSYKENYEIEQIDLNIETELRFHIYVLKLFTCIYAFTLWSGDQA
jgi:hypothetical protein